MKIYTIIGGVYGSGKSSLTGAIKAERKDLGTIIDVDKLNATLGDKISGGKEAIKKINHCIEHGLSFTQETTLSGARTVSRNNNYKLKQKNAPTLLAQDKDVDYITLGLHSTVIYTKNIVPLQPVKIKGLLFCALF